MGVVKAAWKKMEVTTTEVRIRAALRTWWAPATNYNCKVGQRVHVYRRERRIWEGPFKVSRIWDKHVWVSDNRKEKKFYVVKLLPKSEAIAERKLSKLSGRFRNFNTGEYGEYTSPNSYTHEQPRKLTPPSTYWRQRKYVYYCSEMIHCATQKCPTVWCIVRCHIFCGLRTWAPGRVKTLKYCSIADGVSQIQWISFDARLISH